MGLVVLPAVVLAAALPRPPLQAPAAARAAPLFLLQPTKRVVLSVGHYQPHRLRSQEYRTVDLAVAHRQLPVRLNPVPTIPPTAAAVVAGEPLTTETYPALAPTVAPVTALLNGYIKPDKE
jgi:hypothetical protein